MKSRPSTRRESRSTFVVLSNRKYKSEFNPEWGYDPITVSTIASDKPLKNFPKTNREGAETLSN
jgi:hypothetical protein